MRWLVSKEETCARWFDDLDPGIKTLSASLFKILLWLEDDLVYASGDLEMRCLFRPLGVAWGDERHAATVGVGDTEERNGQRSDSEKEHGLNCWETGSNTPKSPLSR